MEEPQQEKKPLIKAFGLWKNVSKDGKVYFSGTMGGIKVQVFENSYKVENSKAPDYNVYFSEVLRRQT